MKSEKAKLKMTVIASVITAIFVFSTAAVVIADDNNNSNGESKNGSQVEQSIKDAAPKKNNATSNGPRVRSSDYSASTSSSGSSSGGSTSSSSSGGSTSSSSSGGSTSGSSSGSSTPVFTPTEIPRVYSFTTVLGCWQDEKERPVAQTFIDLYNDNFRQDLIIEKGWNFYQGRLTATLNTFNGSAFEEFNTEYCQQGRYHNSVVLINEDGTFRAAYNLDTVQKANPGMFFADGDTSGIDTDKSMVLPDGTEVNLLKDVYFSPLVFDLNRDGVHTVKKTIMYDINGDGKPEKINDTSPKDGVLILGQGRSGLELFGDNTDLNKDGKSDKFPNGFEALKALARKDKLINDKDDMKLNVNDIKFLQKKYKLGMKTGGYLGKVHTLISLGITEIRLGKPGKKMITTLLDPRGNIMMNMEGTGFTIHKKNNVFVDVWHKILNAVKAAINGVQKMFS